MKIKMFFRLLILLVIIVGGYWIYNSSYLEKHPPIVEVSMSLDENESVKLGTRTYWNLQKDIEVRLADASGIKGYKITVSTPDKGILLSKEEVVVGNAKEGKPKEVSFLLPKPDIRIAEGTVIHYEITTTDWSNANFFSGNTTTKSLDLVVDTHAPLINIIASSYKISYGGSALVIFRVISNGITSVEVSNGRDNFKAFPFVKEGYYATILAWPVQNKFFNPTITVLNRAYNRKRVPIPLIKDVSVHYSRSNIKVKENFLNGKLNELIDTIGERDIESFQDKIEKFNYINENIRNQDEKIIYDISRSFETNALFEPINFSPFLPLRGSQVVGHFGDHRTYYLGRKKVSQSLHLGLDIASVRHAPVIASNPGKVTLTRLLGVYGNTTIIYHGFGVSSLYSHLSKFDLKEDDEIIAGTVVGLTGQTGWAFGDHLHLGILVQGHAVRDVEWMDARWIKSNITDVFTKARDVIEDNK